MRFVLGELDVLVFCVVLSRVYVSTLGKVCGEGTIEKIECVGEAIFIGFRVNLFKPCSDISRENR